VENLQFSLLHIIINREQHEKHSIINPVIKENMECSIVEAHAQYINLKVGVSVNHGVSLCFVSLPALQTQAKNNVKSAPASTVLA